MPPHARSRFYRSMRSIEIDAPVERVFASWSRYEDLPRLGGSVRRVKCIDATQVLWDVDIAGRQLVWESRVVERVPEKLIRWESRWGPSHSGEVSFEAISQRRSRLTVRIDYGPRRLLEHLGARLGLVDAHLRRELELFRSAVEGSGGEENLDLEQTPPASSSAD